MNKEQYQHEQYQALATFSNADIEQLKKMFYKNGFILHIDHEQQKAYTSVKPTAQSKAAQSLDDTLNNYRLIL